MAKSGIYENVVVIFMRKSFPQHVHGPIPPQIEKEMVIAKRLFGTKRVGTLRVKNMIFEKKPDGEIVFVRFEN